MAAWIVRTCALVKAGFRPPLRPRRPEAGDGPLADELALEFRKCRENAIVSQFDFGKERRPEREERNPPGRISQGKA